MNESVIPDEKRERLRICLPTSTGGHLAQLMALDDWLNEHECLWICIDRADSSSTLKGRRVIEHFHPTTRNLWNAVRNVFLASKVLRRERPDLVLSTGAGVAIPFFFIARILGIKTAYIEVVDRIDSPTLSGRLARLLGAKMFTQWSSQERFYPGARTVGPLVHFPKPPEDAASLSRKRFTKGSIFVTVGTDKHQFNRVIRWTERWVRCHGFTGDVVVQSGHSDVEVGEFKAQPFFGKSEVRAMIERADVVITHGGPGAISDVLAMGKVPVVLPRNPSLGEHVDGHQQRFVQHLSERGIVRWNDSYDDFEEAVLRSFGVTFDPYHAGGNASRVLAEAINSLVR